jgi:metallo-beta-lactamase class B
MSTDMKTIFTIAACAAISLYSTGCASEGKKQSPATGQESSFSKDSVVYQSDKLIITRIAPQTYVHTSYLQTNDFGKVPCNGMVVVDGTDAAIFDTPVNDSSAVELIDYLKAQHIKPAAVVATHFHGDCVGGLKVFQDQHIPSYATEQTISLLQQQPDNKFPLPDHPFTGTLELPVGKEKVSIAYYGPGHTKDNVVAYFAKDKVLFGGCLIKEIDATKGFLGDADTLAWTGTVQKVKSTYADAQFIIPGHGQWGGKELLEYTMKLFAVKAGQ